MKEITAKQLEEKIASGEVVKMIDVREDDEIALGKIPGAIHIRLEEIPKRVNELNKNDHYFVVCRSGGRSGHACEYLSERGYNVTNVSDGMLAWEGEME